jgi:penicillin-binding protein 1B
MWQRKKILRVGGIAALVLLLAASAFTLYLDQRVRTEFEGRRFALPARIYARPLELHVGLRIAQPDLEDELRDLGYKPLVDRPDPTREAEGGWYVRSGERLDIGLRAFTFWDGAQPARHVRLAFEGGTLTTLTDAEGREVPLARLEPLPIGGIYPAGNEDRCWCGSRRCLSTS